MSTAARAPVVKKEKGLLAYAQEAPFDVGQNLNDALVVS